MSDDNRNQIDEGHHDINVSDADKGKAGTSRRALLGGLGLAGIASALPASAKEKPHNHSNSVARGLKSQVKNIVVIFAENRSFNNLFPDFPGLKSPLSLLAQERYRQVDRNGVALDVLPPIWEGLVPTEQVVNHQTYKISQDDLPLFPNRPFGLANQDGDPLPQGVVTRDLVHAFYNNQMQINGGRNDQFVAWGDSGALVMGHYCDNRVNLRLWRLAQDFTLCDNFFMGAFGGSFLNHQYLIAAQPPFYSNAIQSPARSLIADVEGGDPAGARLRPLPDSPLSALDGPPKFGPSALTPDFYAVNTMAPPYAPTSTRSVDNPDYADSSNPKTLPPQTHATIGDRLSAKGISWAWYGGGWGEALRLVPANSTNQPQMPEFSRRPNFQDHHQPFNYFTNFEPGTDARRRHLRDGGVEDSPRTNRFLAEVAAGTLPQVAYYKPQGNLNMHAGYSDVEAGDRHIANVVNALQSGPQWEGMVIVITFDENGGWWDHVAPPKGDRWGPGMRIPAIVVSPFAKRAYVDHTVYDTGSIARLIIRRFELETLPGLTHRELAMQTASGVIPGDLTASLDLT